MSQSTPTQVPFADHRADFPILSRTVYGKPLVYLDNAASAQKPEVVIEAIERYFRSEHANVHRGVHFLSASATGHYEAARERSRQLLNAPSAAEVIFTKGCTEAVNLVANGLSLQPGDVVLVSQMEHHSNIVPWQLAAKRAGAQVIPIPITDSGEIDQEAYRDLLKAHPVRLVGVVHISNSLGTINPIREMAAEAHAHGALFLADGAQAVPHQHVDVQDLDVDFYTVSGHKMYGPTGIGLLYGKRAVLERMEPYQGGGDMIRTVSFDGTTFAEIPAKFEAGTPPISEAIGLAATIDYLEGLTGNLSDSYAAIAGHEEALRAHAEAELTKIEGVRIIGTAPNKAAVVSFVLAGVHPHDIGTILDHEGIAIRVGHHCCMPVMRRLGVPATARASFSLYNTHEEVEALVQGVRRVKEMFS